MCSHGIGTALVARALRCFIASYGRSRHRSWELTYIALATEYAEKTDSEMKIVYN